jgi:cobalt-zinc-cadmium efflux system outer membrane protein
MRASRALESLAAALSVAALAQLCACAGTSPAPAFRHVAARVQERSGQPIRWAQATPEDAQVDAAVRALLGRDLGVDAAVQIALLRNRTLVATYEELSISQADVVQAGLLKNPVLSAGVPAAEVDSVDPPLIVGVAQDFLDLILMPARRSIAQAQLEATELRVADEVLAMQAQVRGAFFALQGAEQRAEMRRVVAETADAAATAAQAQRDAGNLSELDFETQRVLAEQARVDLARDEADVRAARERLSRLMGLWGDEVRFTVPPALPELPPADPPLDRLEQLAVAQRSDLAAMRKEVEAIGRVLSLASSARWTGLITVGLDVTRLKDGRYSFGPNASLELPVFDQRQALVARLHAMQRQSQARLEARAVDARSEVREVRDRLLAARAVADRYRTVLVPLRERIVALAQERYGAMLLGVYELLLAKQSEVNTYREYIEAVQGYWGARSDLERAVGGRLAPWPSPPARAAAAPEPLAPPAHEHHHGG